MPQSIKSNQQKLQNKAFDQLVEQHIKHIKHLNYLLNKTKNKIWWYPGQCDEKSNLPLLCGLMSAVSGREVQPRAWWLLQLQLTRFSIPKFQVTPLSLFLYWKQSMWWLNQVLYFSVPDTKRWCPVCLLCISCSHLLRKRKRSPCRWRRWQCPTAGVQCFSSDCTLVLLPSPQVRNPITRIALLE